MVGIAVLMFAMVACGLLLLWRRRVDTTVWYLKLCQLAFPLGFIAVIAGWTTTAIATDFVTSAPVQTIPAADASYTSTTATVSA